MMTESEIVGEFSLEEFVVERLCGKESSQAFLVKEVLKSYRKGQLLYQDASQEVIGSLPSFIIRKGQSCYVQKNDLFVRVLVQELQRLQRISVPLIYQREVFEKLLAINTFLTSEQKFVIEQFFTKSFGVLCGGPGTGKTFTASIFIKFLISALDRCKKNRYKVLLSAPTGKAALHLQSYLQNQGDLGDFVECEAMTLHRLLKVRVGTCQVFSRKIIDADVVIVDEASMIDISMMVQLLESIGPNTKLLLMGDPNQLPPIEMAGVFAEVAACFGCFLTQCMRTQVPSLVTAAQSILKGDFGAFSKSVEITENFSANFIDFLLSKSLFALSSEEIDIAAFFGRASKIKILNAMRQGPFGLEALNRQILQKIDQMCPKNHYWAVPILVTQNISHMHIYNGTLGVLVGKKNKAIDLSSGIAYFLETDLKPHINPPPFELSFVMSIHKSQGSEFDEVLALFPEGSENFGKEALYTAATRAKKSWSIVAKPGVLEQMIQRNNSSASILGLQKLV